MTPLAIVDTETTGLDPDVHEIWEVALILRTEAGQTEYVWQLPVDLGRADVIGLNIGQFNERRWPWPGGPDARADALIGCRSDLDDNGENGPCIVHPDDLPAFADQFATLTGGAHLVGAVPSFDDERLRKLLRRHGACPGWHYHLVDVEALAAGRLGVGPPWNSRELSAKVGVDPGDFAAHTALGDARWAAAVYDAVLAAEPAEAEGATSESEDRQALDHICQFLCRIGGWDEIDGDGDEGSIIVDHIGRILDPPWAESAEGASTCEQINGVTP